MKYFINVTFILIATTIFAQTDSVIKNAIQLGDEWKFEEAISLLKNEIQNNPDHAEAYYWLGRYSHYIVYDTRPFANKSDEWSKDEVLSNLKKAVELKPDYGDAKYFLAAEHGARALEALKINDIEQYKKEFTDAAKAGGFPLHILEHGRNILKSCDENAILIVQGDMQFNTIQYLQNFEGLRKDVSLLVLALFERPYYIKLIRDGIDQVMKPVSMNFSDNLIMEMHNYKWKTNDIIIPIRDNVKATYNVPDSINHFVWTVKPDVGEKKLWSGTAVLINILESNKWERPVHFSFESLAENIGLGDYLQTVGMTVKLLPYKINDTEKIYDKEQFETLMLNPDNYIHYADVKDNEQPRVSPLTCYYPRMRLLSYAYYLFNLGEIEKAKDVLNKMNEFMPGSVYPIGEGLENGIKALREKL
jgi:tetratricopeptide (TPR) repeat protein